MKKTNIALIGLLMGWASIANAQTVKSPNGNVAVTFSLTGNGVPTYEMTYKGKAVVKPSHLGLELAKDKHASKGMDETSLMDGFEKTGTKTTTFDETWKPVWGETATIRNHYNELEVDLNQPSSKRNIERTKRENTREMNEIENTSLSKRNIHSSLWQATIRHGGFLETMTRRSRRRRNQSCPKSASVSMTLLTGATHLLQSSQKQVFRPLYR